MSPVCSRRPRGLALTALRARRNPPGSRAERCRAQEAGTRRTAPLPHDQGPLALLPDLQGRVADASLQIITDKTFEDHQGFDLATFDDRTIPATELPSYRVLKSQPFVEFRAQIAKEHGYAPEDVRLWVLVNRQNKTVRPDAPVSDQDPTMSASAREFPFGWARRLTSFLTAMETVRDKMASRQQDLKLYLEYIDPEMKAQWTKTHGNESPIMVFVKQFDVAHQTLTGTGHFYVHRHMRVSDLALMINERRRFPPNTPLKIYEVR